MAVHVQSLLSTYSSPDGPPHQNRLCLHCTTTSLDRTLPLLIAVQWSMNYVDALHLSEFQIHTSAISRSTGHPEYIYNVSRRFQLRSTTPNPILLLAHPLLFEPPWGPPEPRPPPGPTVAVWGAWEERVGARASWAGPTLASRPATPAWAFVAEVGGGTGREGKREGRREGGEGEENGKGEWKRGTGRR